jgi:hypothetical protein
MDQSAHKIVSFVVLIFLDNKYKQDRSLFGAVPKTPKLSDLTSLGMISHVDAIDAKWYGSMIHNCLLHALQQTEQEGNGFNRMVPQPIQQEKL